jgi:hypothetical protein
MTLDEMPEVLTVPEVARVLRISRGSAYAEARRFELTGGREGLPVVRIGRSMRTPREQLRRWILARGFALDGAEPMSVDEGE